MSQILNCIQYMMYSFSKCMNLIQSMQFGNESIIEDIIPVSNLNAQSRPFRISYTQTTSYSFSSEDIESESKIDSEEIKRFLQSYSNERNKLENRPFKTKSMLDKEKKEQQGRYSKVRIKFKFMPPLMSNPEILVEAVFTANELGKS
jgi:hypothetical protein